MPILRVNEATALCTIQCKTCGVWHAIPEAMYETCKEHGGYWHCPNGHQWGYGKGHILEQLENAQAALAKEKQRREWAEQNAEAARNETKRVEARRIAQKGATTRLANRAKAGVCPCCTRTFKQLAAHMKNKHPEFTAEEASHV